MKKRKTLKYLVIFAGVLFACMFFARTIQTITTPKVNRIQATRGKLEEKLAVSGTLTFSDGEEVFMPQARKLGAVVTDVLAKQGYFVKKGDVIIKAVAPSYQDEVDKLQLEHVKAIRALGEHMTSQVRLQQDSPHNQVYDAYFDALIKAYEASVALKEKAAAAGYQLPPDSEWAPTLDAVQTAGEPKSGEADKALTLPTGLPDDLNEPMTQAIKADRASKQAFLALRNVYKGQGGVQRVGSLVFDYIKKAGDLKRAVDLVSQQMIKLSEANEAIKALVAPHDGYITAINIKKGETTDGSKPLFVMSKVDEQPVIKCDISAIKKTIEKGMKVQIEGARREVEIANIEVAADGKKYAIIEATKDLLGEMGGVAKILSGGVQGTIQYKSARTSAILPASAVRGGNDGEAYVFVIQQTGGGMLGNSQYQVKKQNVTVLERSTRMVAVSDEVSYQEIADKEDRAIKDGQVVMDYVD